LTLDGLTISRLRFTLQQTSQISRKIALRMLSTNLQFGLKIFAHPIISCKMNSTSYRVRRATLDDLPQLTALWESMRLSTEELGRRVTEFQVAENDEFALVGAVGLQIASEAREIHSEAFTDFALSDQLRPDALGAAPIRGQQSRIAAALDPGRGPVLETVRPGKGGRRGAPKTAGGLENPNTGLAHIKTTGRSRRAGIADKEFATFMEAEKQRSLRTIQHAKVLKFIAAAVAFA